MSLASELRKFADLIDIDGAKSARKMRIPIRQYNIFKQVNELESVKTIVDVGGKSGEKIRDFNKFFPGVCIHAFEPLVQYKENLDDLQKKMNCLKVHNFALGTEANSVNMNQNAYGPSSSILGMLQRHKDIWPKTEESSIIEVEMKTLDQIYQQEKFESPAVLKIDVQGYELQVLKGATNFLKICNLVQLEVLFEPLYKDQAEFAELASFLSVYGFKFKDFVDERRIKKGNKLVYADAAFIKS